MKQALIIGGSTGMGKAAAEILLEPCTVGKNLFKSPKWFFPN